MVTTLSAVLSAVTLVANPAAAAKPQVVEAGTVTWSGNSLNLHAGAGGILANVSGLVCRTHALRILTPGHAGQSVKGAIVRPSSRGRTPD